jgi:hypothetical protein
MRGGLQIVPEMLNCEERVKPLNLGLDLSALNDCCTVVLRMDLDDNESGRVLLLPTRRLRGGTLSRMFRLRKMEPPASYLTA